MAVKLTNGLDTRVAAGVLAGVTLMIGGTEVAVAATTPPETKTFSISAGPFDTQTRDLDFAPFDPLLGTLTGVNLELDSFVTGGSEAATADATVLFQATSVGEDSFIGPANQSFAFGPTDILPVFTPADFIVPAAVTFTLQLVTDGQNAGGEPQDLFGWDWVGDGEFSGLSLSYTYDEVVEAPDAVPLPAALPLFATGLAGAAGLGYVARRRKAKRQANGDHGNSDA